MRTTTDDLIVMLASRARAARRRVREVEAYHRRVAHGELARLAQELEAARLAAQDADERAKARERQLVQAHDALTATERERDAARAERNDTRSALAEALTRVEAREEEIRRLSNRIDAAERARDFAASEVQAADRERAVVEVQANAEIRRLRREVEIRDAGIEMGVAIVRWFDAPLASLDDLAWALRLHEADEAARAAHPLARGGS
jgi:fused signal recognition particle receptor